MSIEAFPAKQSATAPTWRLAGAECSTAGPRELSGDRKSSIADGWKTGASDDKRWWRSSAETPTSLDSRWLVEFLSEVRLSLPVYTSFEMLWDVFSQDCIEAPQRHSSHTNWSPPVCHARDLTSTERCASSKCTLSNWKAFNWRAPTRGSPPPYWGLAPQMLAFICNSRHALGARCSGNTVAQRLTGP